jgi:hypothetical protein
MSVRNVGVACAAAALGLLVACGGDVSQENYDKVQTGMTLDQVEQILGPGEDQSASGVEISSSGMAGRAREDRTKTYLWKDGPKQIIVEFKEGKVIHKAPKNLD